MKTIAITGTTSGIGKATRDLFIRWGWDVLELNRPNFDVRDLETIQNYTPPKLDVFVNNAGIMLLRDFEKTSSYDWWEIINTNLRGPFFLCQRVIPQIKDGGHLINIASISGIHPDKEFIAYSISKAGLIVLSQALSKRYGNRIFVNSISPGFVDTDLCMDIEPVVPQHLIDDIPMQRQAAPEEVAKLVWFIANNKYLNGANIRFDGGLLAKYAGGI